MAVITKEEHERNQRRRMRQLFGALLGVLVLVGVVTIVRAGAGLIGGLFDKTDEYAAYTGKLEGFVMFDPLPFDGIENMDDTTLRSAAVWGTVYGIMDTQKGFDTYARDPDTDMVMLPSVEVDAYLAKVLGPAFKMDHKSFDMEDMSIIYDDVSQCYLIPVTSSVGSYTPQVTKMFKKGGKLYVTVGYVPVTDEFDITTAAGKGQPVKYMDYVFDRTNGSWFLTGLVESETKPDATATSTAQAASSETLTDSDVESAILAGVNGEGTAPSQAGSEAAASSEAASSESASSSAAA
jgi:hypothetical protein